MRGKSLDPRVQRLPDIGAPGQVQPKAPLDQFGTFEVFVQPREGKPFQHEGAVHAPNLEMAFVLAKETFTRRFTCVSLYVVETRRVFVSPFTEGNQTVYAVLTSHTSPNDGPAQPYEIFLLTKRGKQHVHAGTVTALSPQEAVVLSAKLPAVPPVVFNVWAVRRADIRFTRDDEKDLWHTLPEKKFRDATDYKGGDKLKEFLERSK